MRLHLKPQKEQSLLRFHPWVFSGAIARMEGAPSDGDTVQVCDSRGRALGLGHYHQGGSIAVRMLTFDPNEGIGADFWKRRLQGALTLRRRLGLLDAPERTNAYRLVHGEGDGLSGLIIDIYGDTAVLQAHSIGMHRACGPIAQALMEVYAGALTAVYDKSADTLPERYAAAQNDGYLAGGPQKPTQTLMRENGRGFWVDWKTGQKTGFFLDQRDNRALLAHYAPTKTVLNAFSYSGGFSVYALSAGAERVDSVDVSQKALDLLEGNLQANALDESKHRSAAMDVLRFLDQSTEPYDIVVLDPPAYAKSLSKRHNAVQGYKRLNVKGLQRTAPGGLLFTFSCSQVVDAQLFYDTVTAAAIEAGRRVRVLHRLSQPADHPVNLFHPEGGYLKGLVLYVE